MCDGRIIFHSHFNTEVYTYLIKGNKKPNIFYIKLILILLININN